MSVEGAGNTSARRTTYCRHDSLVKISVYSGLLEVSSQVVIGTALFQQQGGVDVFDEGELRMNKSQI